MKHKTFAHKFYYFSYFTESQYKKTTFVKEIVQQTN